MLIVLVVSAIFALGQPQAATLEEGSSPIRIIIGPQPDIGSQSDIGSQPEINKAVIAPSPSQFTYDVGGTLIYDVVRYQGYHSLQGLTTGYTSESGFRRARLAIDGALYGDWEYDVGLNFTDAINLLGSNSTGQIFRPSYSISYSGFSKVEIAGGQISEPFSLEGATSSSDITFMERGLPHAFSPPSNLGIRISAAPTKEFYLAVGGFTEDPRNINNLKKSFTGRVAYAPIHTKNRILHLGTMASYRLLKDRRQRYRSRAESSLTPAWFTTGTIGDVDRVVLTGLETAAVWGSVSVQTEYERADISLGDGDQRRRVDGYYVYASWFLTGESRPYKNGSFDSIKPKNGSGAWEVAVRNSAINDRINNGSKMSDITLGLNWYINKYARLMANYVYVNHKKDNVHGNARIFQMRGQIDF
ncbi:MAG: porin [Candidatus Nitrotoga sp.]